MNQQQIKDKMTCGEWVAIDNQVTLYTANSGNIHITTCDCSDIMPSQTPYTDGANAEAICHAINSTYHQDIDPTKVPDIIKAAWDLLEYELCDEYEVAQGGYIELVDSSQLKSAKAKLEILLTSAKIR